MNARDELALRKEFLLAQSAAYRAQLEYEVLAVRTKATRGASWITRGVTLISLARNLLSLTALFRK
jgi:hypothetical protein